MRAYRRFIFDYVNDTSHLTLTEHGAYTLMLDSYYATQSPLPSDRHSLYRVVRALSPDEQKAVDAVLSEFWTETDTGWTNPRAERELRRAGQQATKGRGKEISSVTIGPESETQSEQVAEVFTFWQETMRHPRARLDDQRRKIIFGKLRAGYSVEDLKQAIVGCSITPHNCGENDRGQRYDGLHVILRSSNIDRFIATVANPPAPKPQRMSGMDRMAQTAQAFIKGHET